MVNRAINVGSIKRLSWMRSNIASACAERIYCGS